jgi:hypothetical protein
MGIRSALPGFTAESALGLPSHSYGYLGGHATYIQNGGIVMELDALANLSAGPNEKADGVPSSGVPATAPFIPQQSDQPLPAARRGATPMLAPSYVYAVGRVEPRFPSLGVEKEFAQATRGVDANTNVNVTGLTNREALHYVLQQQRYLVRQLCWVMTIQGLENYILVPRDPADADLLVEALRPAPSSLDLDVVIGILGPIAPAQMCNGLMVPIVMFDQIYSFDRDTLIHSIPNTTNAPEDRFKATADYTLEQVLQTADNAGAMDEHRALNYLAMRYHAIYATAADMHARDYVLTAIDVRPSRLSGVRRILDVIFSYNSRNTDVVEKFFVRVDVTEEFPFLVTKMSQFYER